MTGPRAQLEVGRRYINAKNRQPLTLLYIGPLPPNTGAETSGPSATTIWLGVEYDDPTYGKGHSGTRAIEQESYLGHVGSKERLCDS